MAKPAKLTAQQTKAIPVILAGRTYEQGCERARIAKSTFYEWLQTEAFRAEFDRVRDELAAAAFGQLSQNIGKAIEVLVGLLDDSDKRLRRLTAKDILDHFLKHKELHDLEERIAAIEQKLTT